MTFPSHLIRRIAPALPLSSLALPADILGQLQNIVSEISGATPSASATTLFLSGSSTSSALAAEAVAHTLGRSLLRVDLGAVTSQYIGETEKNLDHLLGTTDSGSWILFFDEADALFGKRTEIKDGHDRYANAQVSYLLQRLESFPGLVIVATASSIDPIPCRLVRYAVHFPQAAG